MSEKREDQSIIDFQRSQAIPKGEGRLFPDTKGADPANKDAKPDADGKAAPIPDGTGGTPGTEGKKAADPTGAQKANGKEAGGKPAGQTPPEPKSRFKDLADADAYAKAKDAEVQRINEELKASRELLFRSSDALKDHEELRQFKERVTPFVPDIEVLQKQKDVLANVVVPEEEMTGEDKNGNKVATDADRLRIIRSDPKLDLAYQKAIYVGMKRAEAEELAQAQAEIGRVIADVESRHPEITNPEIQKAVQASLGSKVGILQDGSIPITYRALLLEKTLEAIKTQATNTMSPEELNAIAEARALEIEKAKMLDGGSRLAPTKEDPTGQESQIVAEIDAMKKVAGSGKLPYDAKKGR